GVRRGCRYDACAGTGDRWPAPARERAQRARGGAGRALGPAPRAVGADAADPAVALLEGDEAAAVRRAPGQWRLAGGVRLTGWLGAGTLAPARAPAPAGGPQPADGYGGRAAID